MSKKSFWFKHDASIGRDLNMRKMVFIYGHWGKGVFWDVCEMLCTSIEYKYPNDEFELKLLADLIGCKEEDKFIEWFKKCVELDIFKVEETFFYSPMILEVMEEFERKKNNGSKGGRPRKNQDDNQDDNQGKNQDDNQDDNHKNIIDNKTEDNIILDNNKKEKVKKESASTLDFDKFLAFFNQTFNKRVTVFDTSIKNKYKARLKSGYTKENIIDAMINVSKDSFHVDTNYKHIGLDFFARPDKLTKYGFKSEKKTVTNNYNGTL